MANRKLIESDAIYLIKNMKTFFFDCDGVLWNSFGTIPGSVQVVNKLREMNKQLFFVTNNSSTSRHVILKKFQKYGFTVQPNEILSTAYLAALYVKDVLKLKNKVYMIGSKGMVDEFDEAGVNYIGYGPLLPSDNPSKDIHQNFKIETDPDVGAVVVGWDEYFNLNKVAQAMQYLKDSSIPFVATNCDNKYPHGGNIFTPGTGCIVAAVAKAVEREPLYLGKPSKFMFEITKSRYDIDPETTLMIGDRLDTDILFGKNCGFKTLCVLSGVTTETDLEKNKEIIPDFVAENLTEISMAMPVDDNIAEDWSLAYPFDRKLELTSPFMHGKDVVILQNLLRRHPGINLTANGDFDENTKKGLIIFQNDVKITPADGVLMPVTARKVIEYQMSDRYKDDGKIPDWCKFKLYVPVHRDRTIETTAILYAGNGDILHKFTVRTRGGTGKEGQELNQLTTNGNTPTGLSTFDLNSREPEKLVKSFGPYPVLRCVKGVKGNSAIGKDNYIGPDGKDTFLSNYRTGILLHTGIWDGWDKTKPMPNSLGCMHTSMEDMKIIDDLLVSKTNAVVNENPFGKIPYPFKPQGIISIEQID